MKLFADFAALDLGMLRLFAGQMRNVYNMGFQRVKEANLPPLAIFAREWLSSPRKTGAVCPSGSALAEAMAKGVPAGTGLVVELGAGTGAVTAALLRRGIAPERIIAVEQSAALANLLRRRFPQITVLHGDAAALSQLLPAKRVDCIVSSIPLVSLPKPVCRAIVKEMKKVLQGGPLVQFTYLWGGSYLKNSGLTCVNSSVVLRNIPPARVMTFDIRKQA